MKSLPLSTIDIIHTEGLLSHESHLLIINTNGDMLTVSQVELLMASIIQEVI
jgi:hypothetical protein